jgi:predicted ATPase/signal transduction histidine kinase
MQPLAGYILEDKIHESAKTVVYRGHRDSDETPVVIKLLNTAYPTLSELIRLRNQYTIAKNLNLSGIIKPLSLENYHNGFALVLEDFGGKSLKDYITFYKLTLTEFLKLAIQIAEALDGLVLNRIIHKDIKPHNILINPQTFEVKITDFSISSLLPKEQASIINPNRLEGSLAYISPEQTGRMNRGIDYRSDFYSLGVTFYEMLTGQLPFTTSDPMELVHCHIALQPMPPRFVNSAIPSVVSDIVMKLMAKTAEERYQSARGLKADLETCLSQLENKGKIERFVLGRRDISEKFHIPEKLYGRQAEIDTLMAAFERVSLGSTEMMLVAGYSGIGKSALVHEVHKPIVRQRGYFISGKFDQFKRNIPFASLVQAFRDLIQQLLTETKVDIAIWHKKLTTALGSNGQVIIDVIPEVEKIVGQQPAVQELGPTESQNRFNLVFQNFIRVFTQAEHPLVLFLDDLQWADSASLKLIQLLMTDPDTKYLFFIGAYRDNEVSPVHPTMLTLDEIKKTGATVNKIVLHSLGQSDVNSLIADALSCPQEQSKLLSELVFQKTEGNPFFATQFLTSLYNDELLSYDSDRGYWQCDLAKVKALAVSDNVVEFMAAQLQKLPIHAQGVLKLAACIGHKFDLETLSIVYEKSPTETAADLWRALQSGLILPCSDIYKFFHADTIQDGWSLEEQRPTSNGQLTVSYKFLHDRVQQAAYSLIPETDKKATHLKIGQLLLKNTKSVDLEENIFDLVNQLNIGSELLANKSEKNNLASLNLIAGRKAKLATAYEPAVRYLNSGLDLLAADSWTDNYELTLQLYVAAVEAEYLNINFEKAKQLSEEVLRYAKDILDGVKVYELQILFYVAQNQPREAISTARSVLKMLGISIPTEEEEINICATNLKNELSWSVKRIEDLANLPVMTDPYQLATMRILMSTLAPAYQADPLLLQLIACTMVKRSIQYGNSPQAIPGYGYYGVLLCGVYDDLDSGYRFGQLTVKVWEQFNVPELKVKAINLFNSFVRYWKDHVKDTIEPLRESVQSGIEAGDLEYAFYNAVHHGNHLFFIGEPLESLNLKLAQYIEMTEKLKLELHISWFKIWRQRVLNLLGQSEDPCQLVGESFNELEVLPIWEQENSALLVFSLYCCKTMLMYLFQEYKGAVEAAKLGEKYEQGGTGLIYVPEHNFYYSLALLAHYDDADVETKKHYLEKVQSNQEKMAKWSNNAPMNFQHKYDLVEAEKSRILGQNHKAQVLYDRAISGASKAGYIQEEALGNELAAKFYLSISREKIGQVYMTDAYYAYIRWGAIAKAQDLEKQYPQYLHKTSKQDIPDYLNAFNTIETISIKSTHTTSPTTTGESSVLDLTTVMKASLALSEEILLDKLLESLMKVILENAGAQKGCLIMEKAGKLVIEAIGSINRDDVAVLQSIPIEDSCLLPVTIINYVEITQSNLVLKNALKEPLFKHDPYINKFEPKSILCSPIIYKGKRQAILYLENNLSTGVFTEDRLQVLKLLSSQAAISLENALLYHNLQSANEALQHSEAQLQQKATQLEQSLHSLQQTQIQLIQSEKMSSLGQLIAGVAHEINNPVGFITGNISHAEAYVKDMINLLNLYAEKFPNPGSEIEEEIETIDLEYLKEDLPHLICSLKGGTERIRNISTSLRTFSRSDTTSKVQFNLHDGIDSTLLILKHRLKANGSRPAIEVIKEYGCLPEVKCLPGQINQVFMNIIANAIDALEESNIGRSFEEIMRSPNKISIRTEIKPGDRSVVIRIKDNGPGMSESIQKRVFDHLFTTKPVGSGTGLGLSISHQIVVEKHGGKLSCISAPGVGAEFAIELPL